VARFHRHDVADLGHAQQGRDAGHQVLAEGGGRAEHVRITGGQLGDLRGQHLGDRVGVRGVGDRDDLGDAGDGRGFRGDRVGRVGQHGDVDLAADLRGAGDAARGGGVQLAAEVFGDDQDLAHGHRLLTPGPWP
jgi:hypothetical protein